MYAEDTAFYIGGKDPTDLSIRMTEAANQFQTWCTLNRLTLNLGKSKILLFSNKRGRLNCKFKEKLSVTIGDYSMEMVSVYHYLGVILDEHLKYHIHMSMTKQQVAYRL